VLLLLRQPGELLGLLASPAFVDTDPVEVRLLAFAFRVHDEPLQGRARLPLLYTTASAPVELLALSLTPPPLPVVRLPVFITELIDRLPDISNRLVHLYLVVH